MKVATRNGGTVGGQIGYRWQMGTWVFGLEAQGNWADFGGYHVSLFPAFANTNRIDAFGLFTGKSATPGITSCSTSRAARRGSRPLLQRLDGYHRRSCRTPLATPVGAPRLGVGLDAPSHRTGRPASIQSLHGGSRDITFTWLPFGVLCPSVSLSPSTASIRTSTWSTARLSYKFGGAGPVVARY